MNNKLADKSCTDFTELLSSSSAVPGGGGAAALMGALSVCLCSMAARLTQGKKKYAEFNNIIEESIEKAARLRLRFTELIDEDAEAFLPLSRAYSIEKDNPERAEIIERESLNACRAPMEMLRLSSQALELLENMYSVGNQLLISDVGCGAAACEAAMKSAAMNVLVNTKGLKDNPQARAYNEEIRLCLENCLPRLRTLGEAVMNGLAD